jgi:hypothetical protein
MKKIKVENENEDEDRKRQAKWVKKNKVRVGDKVRVLSMQGGIPDNVHMVGKVFPIGDITKDSIIVNGWFFEHDRLELVSRPSEETAEKKLARISSKVMELGCDDDECGVGTGTICGVCRLKADIKGKKTCGGGLLYGKNEIGDEHADYWYHPRKV